MKTPLVSLQEIRHVYMGTERSVEALRGLSIDIDPGEFIAITGASGSGKSTLLNIIGTLESPTEGQFYFNGRDTALFSERELAQLRAKQIGFVFQNFNLIDHLTVFENVKLGLRYRGDAGQNVREMVMTAMDRVGIGHRADHLPRQLSGGQQQRCAIARAIVGNPAILLADEPTGNLDSQNAGQILGILSEFNAAGATLIIVTHALSQADKASRIVEMHDGRIHIASRRLS